MKKTTIMKKIMILTMICVTFGVNLFAQQMPHFSQYMFNDFFINPAVAGTKNYSPLRLTLRNQWTNFTDAPKTQTLSFHTNYFEGMGVGAMIINDKTGPLNQTGLELAYAYHMDVSDDAKLSLGLSAKAIQYVLDERKIELADEDDPVIQGIVDKTLVPDASFGAYFFSENYFVGLSVPQLFQTSIRYDGSEKRVNKEIRHYYLTGGYKFEINDDFDLEPSLLVKTILKAPTQFDINVKSTYKDLVWAGISYRYKESIVALIGLEWERFNLGYAYDFTTTNIRGYSAGSHEVMLGMIIDNADLKGNKSKSRFR